MKHALIHHQSNPYHFPRLQHCLLVKPHHQTPRLQHHHSERQVLLPLPKPLCHQLKVQVLFHQVRCLKLHHQHQRLELPQLFHHFLYHQKEHLLHYQQQTLKESLHISLPHQEHLQLQTLKESLHISLPHQEHLQLQTLKEFLFERMLLHLLHYLESFRWKLFRLHHQTSPSDQFLKRQ